jgi:hypothetical protein
MLIIVLSGVLISWEVDAIMISEILSMDFLYSLLTISEMSLRMTRRQGV